jgi:hypothetical protein
MQIMEDRIEQAQANAAYDRACDATEKRMTTKPTKPDVCLSCHAPVEWSYNPTTRTWQAFDVETGKAHKCQEGQP